MNKNKKALVAGVIGLGAGYLLGTVAGFAKLISLGETSFKGSAKVLGIPVMYIENDADGFLARTENGVFIVALIGAAIAIAVVMLKKSSAPKPKTK